MSYEMHLDDFLRWDGSYAIKWRCDTYSGECYTDADAWEGAATRALADRNDLRARLDTAETALAAAQAELAQAREDARVLVGLWHGRFPRSPSTLDLSEDEATDLLALSYQPRSDIDVAALIRRALGMT